MAEETLAQYGANLELIEETTTNEVFIENTATGTRISLADYLNIVGGLGDSGDPVPGTSHFEAVSTDDGSIGGNPILGGPSSSSELGIALGGGWTTVDSNQPAVVVMSVVVETDGSAAGYLRIDVDESGGTITDYTLDTKIGPSAGAGAELRETVTVFLPSGAQIRVRNTADPNAANKIFTQRKFAL